MSIGNIPSGLTASTTSASSSFQSYTLTICSNRGDFDKKQVESAIGQQAVIAELQLQVNVSHGFVRVEVGRGGVLPEKFDEFFHVIEEENGRYLLGPKINVEQAICVAGYTTYVYANGVSETSTTLSDGSRLGVRAFPHIGVREEGCFRDIADPGSPIYFEQPFSGKRLSITGEVTYICPKKWFSPSNMNPHAYYDQITKTIVPVKNVRCFNINYLPIYLIEFTDASGKTELVPVLAPRDEMDHPEYRACSQFPLHDILSVMLQSQHLSFLGEFQKIGTYITIPQFLEFMLKQDEQGNSAILQVEGQYLLQMLSWADDYGIEIDAATRKALFIKHAEGCFLVNLLTYMLNRNPELIDQLQTYGENPSFLTEALRKGRKQIAQLVIQKARERGIEFSNRDRWLIRVWENDLSFTNEAFQALDQEFQMQIFQLANRMGRIECIERLRPLVSLPSEETVKGLSLFNPTMDYAQRRQVLGSILKGLREKRLLLSKTEFHEYRKRGKWRSKQTDIGRIFGAEYARATIAQLGLTHIKVPRKIAVIENDAETVKIKLSEGCNHYFGIESTDFSIFAAEIAQTRTQATYEEMIELLQFVEATGFADVTGSNFILAEDGIYVIDTEFTNFDGRPHLEQWNRLVGMCEENSRGKFAEELRQRSAIVSNALSKEPLKVSSQQDDLLKINGFTEYGKPMKFEVGSFMNFAPIPTSSSSGSQPQVPESSSLKPPFVQLAELFANIEAQPSISAAEMRALINGLHNRMRRQIYKIAAEWGKRPGDVQWGKTQCVSSRIALLGILTEAQICVLMDERVQTVVPADAVQRLREQLARLRSQAPSSSSI